MKNRSQNYLSRLVTFGEILSLVASVLIVGTAVGGAAKGVVTAAHDAMVQRSIRYGVPLTQ